MLNRSHFRYACVSYFLPICLITLAASTGAAQPAHPWSGIAADDASPTTGQAMYSPFSYEMSPRALSADGRFVVFQTMAALVAEDGNGDWDVYLRDRQTRELRRVSVAVGGGNANGVSYWSSISADGRYVCFLSSASNLIAGDTNNATDSFVYDRELQVTVRVTLGPSGEQSPFDVAPGTMSADGRFVTFTAFFDSAPSFQGWLRDRDADGNGVFDEPGLSATTAIPVPAPDGAEGIFTGGSFALSGDGRFIALNPDVYTGDGQYLGTRLYLYDRTTGTTTLVGGATTDPTVVIHVLEPDFGDNHLAYATNAPNLDPDDVDLDFDVFVLDLRTGGHSRVELTHDGAPPLSVTRAPAISRDGRYVAFAGSEVTPDNFTFRDVYVVDRESGNSYLASEHPGGGRVSYVGDYPSISDDGSAVAFLSRPFLLVEYNDSGWDGIVVATALGFSPDTLTLSPDGETVNLEVLAPDSTGWELTVEDLSQELYLLQLSPDSGFGTGSIELSLPPNHSGYEREYRIIAGSERMVVRQPSSPEIWSLDPLEGSAAGGTEVLVMGNGFTPDTTVTFGGQPATIVSISGSGAIRVLTPPGLAGGADVVVTGRNGLSAIAAAGFTYTEVASIEVADSPAVYGGSAQLHATLQGTLGPLPRESVMFFVDDAPVGSAVTGDTGEAMLSLALGNRAAGAHVIRVTFDGRGGVLPATGLGSLPIARVPLQIRALDAAKVYGESLPSFAVAADGFVNGESMAALTGSLTFLTSATATSAPGTYPVTPSGLSSFNYDITVTAGSLYVRRAGTSLSLTSAPNPSRHKNAFELQAAVTVALPGAGTPNGVVTFSKDGQVVGAAALQDGVATLSVSLRKGTYSYTATYEGSELFTGSAGAVTHVVR
jgi:hypothetical protein